MRVGASNEMLWRAKGSLVALMPYFLMGCASQLSLPAKGLPIARLFGVYEANYADLT
jgi:hypothetical protein